MLHSLFLMERASGRILFAKQFGKIKIDENLLSGFLTALDGFARSELKGTVGIENIDMGGIRWVYLDDRGVLYVSASEKTDSPEMLLSQLMAVSATFNEYFNIENDFSELLWDGNYHRFAVFDDVLNQLIQDWEKAKKVQDAAALMDVLDVYQQIITGMGTSVNLGDEFSLNIMEMAFEEESGSWDIERLAQLDHLEFKERLKNILVNFLIMIKETLGADQLFKSLIRQNIYPILKSDWRRIRELDIDSFIIQTLL